MERTYTQEEVERIMTASKRYSALRQYDSSDPLNLPHRSRFDSCLERDVQFAKETLQTIKKYPEFFNSDAAEVIRAYLYLNSTLKQQRKIERKFEREKKDSILDKSYSIKLFYQVRKIKKKNNPKSRDR